jgi:hypothetical protein
VIHWRMFSLFSMKVARTERLKISSYILFESVLDMFAS